jgi:hypothetical protein
MPRFPAAFRPPAFASQVIRPPQGIGPPSRSAYRPRHRARTPTGFPRSTRMRYDRVGCLLYPGGGGAHPADKKSPAGACRFTTASPSTPPTASHRARFTHNETSNRGSLTFTRPVCPLPVTPGWNRSPSASPRASHPAVNQRRTSRAGPGHRAQAWNYATGIGRTSDPRVRSLRATSCRTFFLVSMLTTG